MCFLSDMCIILLYTYRGTMKNLKYKSLIGMLVIAATLSACDDTVEPKENNSVEIKMDMPDGLRDCKVFRVERDNGFAIFVTRCPHSTTTTQAGKNVAVLTEDSECGENEEDEQ